jgi:hypothetical protein
MFVCRSRRLCTLCHVQSFHSCVRGLSRRHCVRVRFCRLCTSVVDIVPSSTGTLAMVVGELECGCEVRVVALPLSLYDGSRDES